MAGSCQKEISSEPILTGCPADTELILVVNSTAPGNDGGYGLRYIKDVRQCWLQNNLIFKYVQFVVGAFGDLLGIGGTTVTIVQSGVVEDSVQVILGGVVLDRNDSSQISYTVAYSGTGFVITFNQGGIATQTYVILYTYAT